MYSAKISRGPTGLMEKPRPRAPMAVSLSPEIMDRMNWMRLRCLCVPVMSKVIRGRAMKKTVSVRARWVSRIMPTAKSTRKGSWPVLSRERIHSSWAPTKVEDLAWPA
jgi:hypothetical protein